MVAQRLLGQAVGFRNLGVAEHERNPLLDEQLVVLLEERRDARPREGGGRSRRRHRL